MRDHGGWMNKSLTDSKFLNDIVVDEHEHWAIWSFFFKRWYCDEDNFCVRGDGAWL